MEIIQGYNFVPMHRVHPQNMDNMKLIAQMIFHLVAQMGIVYLPISCTE
jgi:hypothetical protein